MDIQQSYNYRVYYYTVDSFKQLHIGQIFRDGDYKEGYKHTLGSLVSMSIT